MAFSLNFHVHNQMEKKAQILVKKRIKRGLFEAQSKKLKPVTI